MIEKRYAWALTVLLVCLGFLPLSAIAEVFGDLSFPGVQNPEPKPKPKTKQQAPKPKPKPRRQEPKPESKLEASRPAFFYEPEMVRIPGSCFQFGSPANRKRPHFSWHRVCVDDFKIGKFEVTQTQWQAVMGTNPSKFKNCGSCPVEQTSWHDVQEYLKKLNAQTGKRYRLPTEAEWEFACRGAREGERYCGSNDLKPIAWYRGNSGKRTHPVGRKQGNGFGLHDMSGNVSEWTCSALYIKYRGVDKCEFSKKKAKRVRRGGSWYHYPKALRLELRGLTKTADRKDYVGFRLVQD